MRRETTSVSQEDYLKAIWEMLEEEEIPISARVAEQLGVTPPAVTAALKRMTRDDYLRIDRKGRISLTAKGQRHRAASRAASSACRKTSHRNYWTRLGQSA